MQCLIQRVWDWRFSAISQAKLTCRSEDRTMRTVARQGWMAFRWDGREAIGLTAPRLGGIGKSVGHTNESFLGSEDTSSPVVSQLCTRSPSTGRVPCH